MIMDVSMPDMDGLNAAAIIKSYHPEVHILMFSMHKFTEFIEAARNLGLDGYVPKEEDGPCLRTAVQAIRIIRPIFPKSIENGGAKIASREEVPAIPSFFCSLISSMPLLAL